MEATGLRTVVLGILILGVVVTEMEAKACKTNFCYISCRSKGAIPVFCAGKCGCTRSLASHPSGLVEISTGSISEYCTLGCSSSLCDRMAVGLKTGVRCFFK